MKSNKKYKRTFYWLNTIKFCAGIAVDQDGLVYKWDTAPCYQWMSGKKFNEMIKYLKYKKMLLNCKKLDVEIDPF